MAVVQFTELAQPFERKCFPSPLTYRTNDFCVDAVIPKELFFFLLVVRMCFTRFISAACEGFNVPKEHS